MRLIDAEAWKLELLMLHGTNERTAWIINRINHAPTVDAVPVIRCRDCIYWKRYCRIVDGVASNHVCDRKREFDGAMHRSKADDFCSWAERKEE